MGCDVAGEIDPKALIDTSDMVRVDSATPPSVSLNPTGDPEFSSLSLAPIPPVMGTDTDAARQFYRPGVSQIRMPPLPVQSKIAAGASAQSQVINQQIVSSGGPDLQVNNVDNPVQNILNITGSGVSYGPGKGQVQISSGGSSSAIAGPGFTNPTENPTTYFMSNMMGSSANGIGSILFLLPAEITTTNFNFNVQAGDSSNYYDWGIYGPFTGVETTLPLLCNIGGQKFNATGSITVAWLTPVTLQPGYYFLAITSDGAPPGLQIYADPAISWLYGSLVVTPSTGTGAALALPANITVQTISPVAQTSGAGSNKPQNIVFNLF